MKSWLFATLLVAGCTFCMAWDVLGHGELNAKTFLLGVGVLIGLVVTFLFARRTLKERRYDLHVRTRRREIAELGSAIDYQE